MVSGIENIVVNKNKSHGTECFPLYSRIVTDNTANNEPRFDVTKSVRERFLILIERL